MSQQRIKLIDGVKDSFCEEMECVFSKFPKYHMTIVLGNFNAKVGTEDFFKLTHWNESLHGIGSDIGMRLGNFAT
jgi:hypothetical protein